MIKKRSHIPKYILLHAHNSKGTTALSMAGVTVAGISFAVLLFDLSQYLATRGAAQLAADKAARCIASTDSGCVVESSNGGGTPTQWFGFAPTTLVDVYAQSGEYSASFPQTNWEASVQQYEQRSERRRLTWNEHQLPVTRFVGLLNSWAILKAKVEVRLTSIANGGTLSCILNREREIPWGLPFDSPAVYFDTRWCGATQEAAIQEAVAESSCTGAIASGDAALVDEPTWGSYCSLRLPGVSYRDGQVISENPQPWLLLGGEPVCDNDTVTGGPSSLSQAIPSQPTATAEVGQTERPFPITVERQYVVLDVYSCDSASNLSSKLNQLLPNTATPESLAAFLGAERELTGQEFDPYHFSALTPEAQGTYSLFLSIDKLANSLALPSAYSWTYLRWERQVERGSGDGSPLAIGAENAGRTVLTRKLCGWYEWNEAQDKQITGLHNTAPIPSPLRVSVDDGTCPRLQRVEPSPSYLCANRFYGPVTEDEDIEELCQGWQDQLLQIQNGYTEELARAAGYNQSSPGFAQWLEPLPDFATTPEVEWTTQTEDVQWQKAFVYTGFKVLTPEYQRVVEPLTVSSLVPNAADGSPRAPSTPEWLLLLQSSAPNHLNWSEFASAPSLEVSAVGSETATFDNLQPFQSLHQQPSFAYAIQSLTNQNQTASDLQYDSNLDCQPEPACRSEVGEQQLKQAVWRLVNEQYDKPLPPAHEIALSIKSNAPANRLHHLGTYSPEALANLRAELPACAAIQTSCRSTPDRSQQAKFAGVGLTQPESCLRGELVDCYPVTDLSEHISILPVTEVDIEQAQRVALAEMKRLYPHLTTASTCNNQNCAAITIERGETHVQAEVVYTMPIRFPLQYILSSPYIEVRGSSIEPIEIPESRESADDGNG